MREGQMIWPWATHPHSSVQAKVRLGFGWGHRILHAYFVLPPKRLKESGIAHEKPESRKARGYRKSPPHTRAFAVTGSAWLIYC